MRWLLFFVLLGSAACFAACGDEDVGAHCYDSRDCDGICATGKNYPGGLCTQSCSTSGQCPDMWVCVRENGGICLETCPETAYCDSYYGPGWKCRDRDYQDGPGKTKVCFGE